MTETLVARSKTSRLQSKQEQFETIRARVEAAKASMEDADHAIAAAQSARDLARNRLNEDESRLRQLALDIAALEDRPAELPVTDHAIVRYMERVMGVDFADLHKQIIPDVVGRTAALCGDGKFPVGTSHTVVVRKGIVVTVLTKDTGQPE